MKPGYVTTELWLTVIAGPGRKAPVDACQLSRA